MEMVYRQLGNSGLKISVFSLGSWVTFGKQVDVNAAIAMMTTAYDAGINFFDNAESYASGGSEEIMGAALRKIGWRRSSYLISTKFFWGLHERVNEKDTLNRKRLMEAIEGSLKRFSLDHIDIVYCHRPDPHTPLEETARAMNDMIVQGKALYWGTSEWSADAIRAAWSIADRYGWHKPIVEQPEYNIFNRNRVEKEYQRLYKDIGLGLTTFSPLASGLLTGKYNNGIPDNSRGALKGYEWLKEDLCDQDKIKILKKLEPIAKELGCSMAQFSLGWCAKNPNVSTVITGSSRVEQLRENLRAMELLPKLNTEIMAEVDKITGKHEED